MVLFILAALVCASAEAQRAYKGTVVVVGFSTEEAVIAADSRISSKDDTKDTRCKIFQIDDRTVMALAGITVIYPENAPPHVSPLFDTNDVARQAVRDLTSTGAKAHFDIPVFTNTFAQLASAGVNQLRLTNPSAFRSMLLQLKHNELVSGFIIGNRTGAIEVFRLALAYQPFTDGKPIPTFEIQVTNLEPGFGFLIAAEGETEVVAEFTDQKSLRAREEALKWKLAVQGNPGKDWNALKVIRLAELAIQFQKGKTIGGPIDVVKLTRRSHVQWIRKKPSCGPASNSP